MKDIWKERWQNPVWDYGPQCYDAPQDEDDDEPIEEAF